MFSSCISYIPSVCRYGHCSISIFPVHLFSNQRIYHPEHGCNPYVIKYNNNCQLGVSEHHANFMVTLKSSVTLKNRSESSKILHRSGRDLQRKVYYNRWWVPEHRRCNQCHSGIHRHTQLQRNRSREKCSARCMLQGCYRREWLCCRFR